MALSTWLTPARKTTLVWIAAGAGLFAVAATLAFLLWPPVPPPPHSGTRLTTAILLLRYPTILLAAMVASLFRILDSSEGALDPVSGTPSRRHQINQRVLTNTIEQLVLFIPALLSLAIRAHEPSTFRFVPMAVALFCLGRVLFWFGYHVSPNARGLGFNMTISTSIFALVASFFV
ncbi:MAG: MAPEG family protein [Polyangiaceae bacterium]